MPDSITVQEMARQTTGGTTRFPLAEADIRRKEDVGHWQGLTSKYNALLSGTANSESAPASPTAPHSNDIRPAARSTSSQTSSHFGRASRGSRRQLQDYVNLHEARLTNAVLAALPETLQRATIEWVSPRAEKDYCEYQDYGFLESVGLRTFARELKDFWPPGGPCWDALGILRSGLSNSYPVAVLVEAKSHIPEVRSAGCQASPLSLAQIQRALNEAKSWCGAAPDSDWTGPLYQSANRIAHLYFIRQKLNRPCLLVNLYFVNDPYRPTSAQEWQAAVLSVKSDLGLMRPVPGVIDLFLPATETFAGASPAPLDASTHLPAAAPRAAPSSAAPSCCPSATESPAGAPQSHATFAAWRDEWNELAIFDGGSLPDADSRTEKLLALWNRPIPGRWKRDIDPQLLRDRYRRGDRHAPHPGEHTIEHRILLDCFATVRCFQMQLIDGVNAFPLSCDFAGGGRRGNVEADMLLLAQSGDTYRFFLCEVKEAANNPWYAAVEALRQMKLFAGNSMACQTMVLRGSLPAEVASAPATGLVLAPRQYYLGTGKKQRTLAPARKLFDEFRTIHEVDLRLATWDDARREINELS